MSRVSGRRYEDTPRLNFKKVLATIIAIIVIVLIVFSLKHLLVGSPKKTKDVSTLVTYFNFYENGKWGIIDNKGNIIIENTYDEMMLIPDKNKDIFIVVDNLKKDDETYVTKVINKDGNIIFSNYKNIEPIFNSNGNKTWYESNILKFENNSKFGLVNFEGNIILEAIYDDIYPMPGIEKSLIVSKDGKVGLVSTAMGELIIPVEYKSIKSLTNSYKDGYLVQNEENKFGIISPDKTIILETKYDEIENICGNNQYVIVEGGVKKIIKSSGESILESGFEDVAQINTDSYVVISNSKYGLIDSSGNKVLDYEYDYLSHAFSNIYIASKENKMGIIDLNKTELIGYDYNNIKYVESIDLFVAERDNKLFDIINRNFEKVLASVNIVDLNLDDGYIKILDNDNYRYYNFKLEEQTNIQIFSTNTLFLIKENGKYGYVNKNGEKIVDCKYDDAKEQNAYGYCAVCLDGKWGSLNSDGSIALSPKYDFNDYVVIDFINDYYRINDTLNVVYTK